MNDDGAITLAELYANLPSIECKGLCHGSCGPVPATRAEIAAIDRQSLVPFGVDEDFNCTMLCAGRCTVYDKRPLLCRLWGVARGMPCIFGCVPERVVSDSEAASLLMLAEKVGGGYDIGRISEMLKSAK